MKKILIVIIIIVYITSAILSYNGIHKSYYTSEGIEFVKQQKCSIPGLYKPDIYDYLKMFWPIINTAVAINYTFFDGWKYYSYRQSNFFK